MQAGNPELELLEKALSRGSLASIAVAANCTAQAMSTAVAPARSARQASQSLSSWWCQCPMGSVCNAQKDHNSRLCYMLVP